jgi:hypothetical protein
MSNNDFAIACLAVLLVLGFILWMIGAVKYGMI